MKSVLGRISVGIVVGGLVALSGCVSGGAAPKGGVTCPATKGEEILNKNLVVMERNVQKAGNLLDVELKVRNVTKSDQAFEYRFVWREKGGVVADAPTPEWQTVSVRPDEVAVLKGKAPAPQVVDFLLSLRPAGR
jgi:hypothetical protein